MKSYRYLSAVEYDDITFACYRYCTNGTFVFLEVRDVRILDNKTLQKIGRALIRTPAGKADWADFRAVAQSRPLLSQWVEGLDCRYSQFGSTLYVGVDFSQW